MSGDTDMPQPLSKVRSTGVIDLSPGAINRHPDLALEAMKVVAFWASIEGNLAIILAEMLKADVATGVAMYEALSMGEGRRAAIVAAAKHALPEWQMILFQALLNVTKASRQQRNDFCHHVWATAEGVDDGILLIHPPVITQTMVSFRQKHDVDGIEVVRPQFPDRSKILVYRKKDMRTAVERAANADLLHIYFYNAIKSGPAESRAAGLKLLLWDPRIRQEIAKLTTQNSAETPPELLLAEDQQPPG